MRYYHVAGQYFQAGDPLLSFDRLEELGLGPGPWKWADTDEGYGESVDRYSVALHDNLKAAQKFAQEYGGRVVAVDVPDDDDLGVHELPWGGYINPRLTQNGEGFVAVYDGIPAEWITLV